MFFFFNNFKNFLFSSFFIKIHHFLTLFVQIPTHHLHFTILPFTFSLHFLHFSSFSAFGFSHNSLLYHILLIHFPHFTTSFSHFYHFWYIFNTFLWVPTFDTLGTHFWLPSRFKVLSRFYNNNEYHLPPPQNYTVLLTK